MAAVWFVFGMAAGLIAAGAAMVADSVLARPFWREPPMHLVGRNPFRDELDRALADSRRELRRSPAPWSHPTKRHVT